MLFFFYKFFHIYSCFFELFGYRSFAKVCLIPLLTPPVLTPSAH